MTPGDRSAEMASTGASSHLVVLVACLGILAAAAALEPAESHLRLGPITLPTLCTLRLTTGIPCPGCGLSRSFVAAAHGEWRHSLEYHRLGPLFVVYVLLQVLHRAAWLGLPGSRLRISLAGRFLDAAFLPLMVVLLVNWIPTVAVILRSVL